jgi:hypothetical protein
LAVPGEPAHHGALVILSAMLLPLLPRLMRIGMGLYGVGMAGAELLVRRGIDAAPRTLSLVLQSVGVVVMLIAAAIHFRQALNLRRQSSSPSHRV